MNGLKLTKNKTVIIFFVILALIASGAIYFVLIGNMEDVITINQTVRGGTQITENMITVKKLDKSALPDNYLSADFKKDVVGKYLDLGITAGGILTENNISTSGKSSIIPTGYTLYSIKDLETYPTGLITGDKLNIVISTNLESKGNAVLTFQNILVTNISYDEEKAIDSIELQVTPEQAQYIAYGQANGQISISLLPLDYQNKSLEVIDENSFQNGATQIIDESALVNQTTQVTE